MGLYLLLPVRLLRMRRSTHGGLYRTFAQDFGKLKSNLLLLLSKHSRTRRKSEG